MEKNQTVVKDQIYGFVGTGYSCGKGHGYCTITITKANVDHFFDHPAHWNRDVFTQIDGSGKLHANGINTAFARRHKEFTEKYPNIIWN